jgi:ribosomal protein L20A (L18A)
VWQGIKGGNRMQKIKFLHGDTYGELEELFNKFSSEHKKGTNLFEIEQVEVVEVEKNENYSDNYVLMIRYYE